MFTTELIRRNHHAVMIPFHVHPDDFARCFPQIQRIQKLDGLVFAIPFKQAACDLADELGAQALIVSAIKALARMPDGRWRGFTFAGQRVALIGAGGAAPQSVSPLRSS